MRKYFLWLTYRRSVQNLSHWQRPVLQSLGERMSRASHMLHQSTILTADLLVPVTNASLKLRKQRKRSTCLQQIPHQTRTELLLTISPFNQRSLGPSAHFQVRSVFSDTPRDIVIPEVDCVKMLRSSKLKVAKWCCCLNVFIHSICVNHPVFSTTLRNKADFASRRLDFAAHFAMRYCLSKTLMYSLI